MLFGDPLGCPCLGLYFGCFEGDPKKIVKSLASWLTVLDKYLERSVLKCLLAMEIADTVLRPIVTLSSNGDVSESKGKVTSVRKVP